MSPHCNGLCLLLSISLFLNFLFNYGVCHYYEFTLMAESIFGLDQSLWRLINFRSTIRGCANLISDPKSSDGGEDNHLSWILSRHPFTIHPTAPTCRNQIQPIWLSSMQPKPIQPSPSFVPSSQDPKVFFRIQSQRIPTSTTLKKQNPSNFPTIWKTLIHQSESHSSKPQSPKL